MQSQGCYIQTHLKSIFKLYFQTALCWAVGVEGQCDGEGELGGGGGPLPPLHGGRQLGPLVDLRRHLRTR